MSRFSSACTRIALLLAVGATLLAAPRAPRAQDALAEIGLPGLQADAEAFAAGLRRTFPAGAPASRMRQAAVAAMAAVQAGNWAQALSPLETLAGGGVPPGADWQTWHDLARAEIGVTPPQPKRALQAAWMAFTRIDVDSDSAAGDQVATLRVMDAALRALDQPVPDIMVLQAIARRLPHDAEAQAALASRQMALGLLFKGVTTDAEAFPARACLAFLGEPSPAPDFHAGDWVTLAPARPDAAVTLESHRLCVTGLPAGETTVVTVRHGMSGDNGLTLKRDLAVAVAVPHRQPRLVFDGARLIQPRDAAATVALDSVNLSAVKLTLVLVAERNLLHVMQTYPPGQDAIDAGGATDLAQNQGRVVWTGSAGVANFARNALAHTVLPLPAALREPGLYALIAAPGDGTPFAEGSAPVAVQLVLRTDLAPTVWHGADGDTVQVRSYATGLPVAGAVVDLLAADNERLAQATTDAEGVVRFAQPLLAGRNGLAPAALHITARDDFTRLALAAPDFDLSDRGVSGMAQPGPVDPFIWTDRGIYRPGETVQAMALLRDASGEPVDLPLHLVVTRPDGRVFQDSVPARAAGASIHAAIRLSAGAQTGVWGLALKADPDGAAIAECHFQVDAFVPPRLAVAFTRPPDALEPGHSVGLPYNVRFLYGAPGDGLTGSGSVTLTPNQTPFDGFRQFRFGLADERFTARRSTVDLPATDAAGDAALPVDLTALPDVSGALQATVDVLVNDPAGRSVGATATLPIRPSAPLIGIAEDFPDGAVDANTPAGFRLVAVAPDGRRVAMPVQLRLVRQTPDWRLAVSHGQARYETVWRDEPVESHDLTLRADGAPAAFARTLPFGRYRLQVLQSGGGGMAASSVIFYAGWAVGDDPDVPARVSVRADRKGYRPGETATIHVEAPYAGPATVLVMTDRVRRLIDVPDHGAAFDVPVPVTADWGPGAYVGAHVFRPGAGSAKLGPARAIGLTWVALDPAPRTLPLTITTAGTYRPRTTAGFAVRATPGAWVTLAAVDEGILALTGFKTPDPLGHFFGQRSLGVGIHDDWARLLAPAGAANTILREGAGGDAGDAPAIPIPQVIASLFAGPVQAGPDGVAQFPLALPDFSGTLRLMAVGWDGARSGSAAVDVVVRDQLIVEPLLPRFLAPGDQAQVGVMLQNLELPAGRVTLHVAASGALALAGGQPTPVTLAPAQRLVLPVQLVGQTAGSGTLTVAADGPGGFSVTHQATIAVHPARGMVAQVTALTLAPGATQEVTPDVAAFVPGTWTASASFGLGARYDAAALERALDAYPLDCLEQLASRGLPLAMLPTGPDRAGRLELVTEAVLDRQRFDGAFGLWSSGGEAEPWLSAYATDFLLRAQAAGAAVPPVAIASALGWLANEVATPPDGATEQAAQAAALSVLALAGRAPAGAIRAAAATVASEPTPLARAQIAAALARLGEAVPAHDIFAAVLAEPARRPWPDDYGSALRDQFATAVLAQESGVMAREIGAIRAALPGSDLDPDRLDTQEQAWAAAAAAAMGANAPPVALVADGKRLGPAPVLELPVPDTVTLRNPARAALPGSLVVQGVPREAPPAARAGMEVRRSFHSLDGATLDPDHLARNTSFVMVVDGHASDGQDHRAMLLAGLPAGWEIAGRFAGGTVAGMEWLGTLSSAESEQAADDRFAAALTLTARQPAFRLAVMLRAVTPGRFEYPGMVLSDMYRPAVFARQGTVAITVQPPATP